MNNELIHTSSPYLLQHASNPVYWKIWNEKNLETARKENKLILISIGYSACHWCHVMEHECFENKEVAEWMNQFYVNIKIDREEHPDVDALYMKALQLMTQRGGWPLNIVALPDGRPVWGATYLPKEEWMEALRQLQELYISQPEVLTDYAEKLAGGIELISKPLPSNEKTEGFDLNAIIDKWTKSFDWEYGGYQRAPKFMMPTNLDFLQSYGYLYKNEMILNYIDTTLTRMAWGGIFDVIHGGFSRYSVDHYWHIPHFEKMLYDNAQLLTTYSNAYKRTKNPLYKETVEKTIRWMMDELHTAEGGFMSALDADSISANGKLEEGAYYRWTEEELQDVLKEDFSLFSEVYNINAAGHWEEEYYIFIQSKTLEEVALEYRIELNLLKQKIKNGHKLLYHNRNKRRKPRLDNKMICSWNAMLLSGLIDAQTVLEAEELEQVIENLSHFIIQKCGTSDFQLTHIYKGNGYQNGLLEDYAFVIKAMMDLYEYNGNKKWANYAEQYTKAAIDRFYSDSVGFFKSSDKASLLFSEQYDMEDQVIPSSNAVMSLNLLKLSQLTNELSYEYKAKQMFSLITPQIDYGSAYSHWLQSFLFISEKQQKVTLSGMDALKRVRILQKRYLPNVQLIMDENEKENSYLLCYHDRCLKPFQDFNLFLKEIIP